MGEEQYNHNQTDQTEHTRRNQSQTKGSSRSKRETQILDYSITRENILNHLYMHPQLLSFNSQIFPALQQADSSAAQLSISQNLPILAP